LIQAALSAVAAILCAHPGAAAELRDLYYGEALFHAYQGDYFDALERLDAEISQHYRVDEPRLDSLHQHIDHAEFSVGDFELYYRMHHRAGRAIRAVLEGDVSEPVRNEAAYRLAKIHFQKGQPEEAMRALAGIQGEVPESIRDDIDFLRANVHMALRQPSEAIPVLSELQGSADLEGFATYNLGIALLQDGRDEEARVQLERAGRVSGRDQALLAIRDKSNLVLGTMLFEASQFGPAQKSLDRVRLRGPFSNQALLRAGWADASADNFERALVPWSILAERAPTDAAVQEAILVLPYAYSKLDVHGRAALLYGQAVESFGTELEKVDASIESIRDGKFLQALLREEIRQNEDWVIRLRSLPKTPETFYLMALMASHDFQTALQNVLDLEDLRKRLVVWQRTLTSFEDLVRLRRGYYEPLLPEMDARFRELDARLRLRREQQVNLDQRLQKMLVAARPELLATASEQSLAARLAALEAKVGDEAGSMQADLRARIARLRGVLSWRWVTAYHERLTETHDHLRELNAQVARLDEQYEGFVRSRQAAAHSYVGYDGSIRHLRVRLKRSIERLEGLMVRQGHLLEVVAVDELVARRKRLADFHNQARFAFADSYDRASKAPDQVE
jgi:Flp pilus assembly protein TadD